MKQPASGREIIGAVLGGSIAGMALIVGFRLAGKALLTTPLGLWALPALGLLAVGGYILARRLNKGQPRQFGASALTFLAGLWGTNALARIAEVVFHLPAAGAKSAAGAPPAALVLGLLASVIGTIGIGIEVGRWAARTTTPQRPAMTASAPAAETVPAQA